MSTREMACGSSEGPPGLHAELRGDARARSLRPPSFPQADGRAVKHPLARKAAGVACVVLGTAMLVTPGPGVLVILLGLKMLGVVGS